MITIRVESSQKPIPSQDLFFPSHICAESPDLVYEATMKWREFDIDLVSCINQKWQSLLTLFGFVRIKMPFVRYSDED
jgi:hypothetical protein